MPEPLPITALVTLGCPKNQVDAEQLLQLLTAARFPLTARPEEAGIIIVNTCAFIQPAVEESLETILELAELKNTGSCRYLAVAGCLPQRYGKKLLEEVPEIDLAVGTSSFPLLPALLEKLHAGIPVARFHAGTTNYADLTAIPQICSQPYTAYLKIAEGCNNHCSYCFIPQIKGPQTSFAPSLLLDKARRMADYGIRELNIIAQDITAYGRERPGQSTLVPLLEQLAAIDGLSWLRLLYAYPGKITDELITLLGKEEKICPYLDLPIQHISGHILQRMNRHDQPETIRQTIHKLQSLGRTIHLRSTVIVGFPGETDHDFQLLLDFIAEGHFTYLGCFPYWPETGTRAASLDQQVEDRVKEERCRAIMTCQQEVTSRQLAVYRGKSIPLLVEGVSSETELLLQSRTSFQAPDIDGVTYITDGFATPGTIINGKIHEAHEYDLFAELPEAHPLDHD
ncbi:MAG: 30S ribosomal protein S12 methylthiotransferase RimO [Deltaproteobacteria bacterium]|nr:30S ribosomal protein S12 methylthiotransferase RimO [Candidatus Anaeroferrophillus wilburensis]MBN2890028.1 30S ribosomal protein S12 methylthiotransferase RimO [Deltaproteobacteria bacterium]